MSSEKQSQKRLTLLRLLAADFRDYDELILSLGASPEPDKVPPAVQKARDAIRRRSFHVYLNEEY